MKQVEFTANFEGSENIEIVDDTSSYVKDGLKTHSLLQPFEKKVIAKVELGKEFKLMTYFGVNMKNISKEQ